MDLKDYVSSDSTRSNVISIIGLAKNSGKTTTLNYLITHLDKDTKLGLTSIGRDGEKYDIITNQPKPQIIVKKGVIFATAENAINKSKVKFKEIEKTCYNTPMGLILIGEALNSEHIELAGPSINHQLKDICEKLKSFGCKIILIDGAFDRKAYATPLISDGVILSSGASYSENIDDVIEQTIHIVSVLTLMEEKNPKIKTLTQGKFKNIKIGLVDKNFQLVNLNIPTLLGSEKKIVEKIDKNIRYIIINGAVTDQLLEEIIKNRFRIENLTILIENPTKLLVKNNTLQSFIKTGNSLKVLNPINLIAITINPISPYGYEFNPIEMINKLKRRIDIPIFNLGKN